MWQARSVSILILILTLSPGEQGFAQTHAHRKCQPGSATKGALVLAHGTMHHGPSHSGTTVQLSESAWEKNVRTTVENARQTLQTPVELAFGMWNRESFQKAIERLACHGVREIKVIPLFVSRHTVVYRAQEFLFGKSSKDGLPPFLHHLKPIQLPKGVQKLTLGLPLDDSPILPEILSERADAFIGGKVQPENSQFLLVAHGPMAEDDNRKWEEHLEFLGISIQERTLKKRGVAFSGFAVGTLRDDASERVRTKARQHIRDFVRRTSKAEHVLVIPVLVSHGGIESHIHESLRGLTYTYRGEAIVPHHLVSTWIVKEAQ